MSRTPKTICYKIVKPPCRKECPNRSATCHCTCSDYLKWKEENNAEKNKAYKAYSADKMMDNYECQRKLKNAKKWHKQ